MRRCCRSCSAGTWLYASGLRAERSPTASQTSWRERVEPVHAIDAEQAALLADELPELGARDLLHAAIVRRLGVQCIISADAGFDRLADVERLDPNGGRGLA